MKKKATFMNNKKGFTILEMILVLSVIALFIILTLPNIISEQELLEEEKQSAGYIYSINEEVYETSYPNKCNIENMTCTVDDVTYKVDSIEKKQVSGNKEN